MMDPGPSSPADSPEQGVGFSKFEQQALARSVREINTGLFFEAHETLEFAWTLCHSPYRPFLQAIIHVAVGCHHARNGNRPGLERQFAKARRKLAPFLPSCASIDTGALDSSLAEMLAHSASHATGQRAIPLPLVAQSGDRAVVKSSPAVTQIRLGYSDRGCASPDPGSSQPSKTSMRRALSTHLFVHHRLSTATLQRILSAGVELVEIFCARQHLEYDNPQQVQEVASYLSDSPLKVHSVHLPMFNDAHWGKGGPGSIVDIANPSKSKRIAAVDEVKRALDLADHFPFRFAVQHLGVGFDDEWSMHKVDAAFSSLEELKSFAHQRGVEILLENIPNALSGARKLLEFFEITHLNLGVCFDVGHAHLMEGVEAAFALLEDRIFSLHVHDNNGHEDKHLFPGFHAEGTVDWKRTMELLRRGAGRYPLLLELKDDSAIADPLAEAIQVFDHLEKQ